jgi:hypothetical protein
LRSVQLAFREAQLSPMPPVRAPAKNTRVRSTKPATLSPRPHHNALRSRGR